MSTTVLSGFTKGERATLRMMLANPSMGIVASPRRRPGMFVPALKGYHLGCFDYVWASHTPTTSTAASGGALGAITCYVKIVPLFTDYLDPNADYLRGPPCQVKSQAVAGAGNDDTVVVSWNPMPDGYPCNGYEIYASDDNITFYSQGTVTGRWNTTYTITGSAGTVLQVVGTEFPTAAIGPPQFCHSVEVYQGEGSVDSRCYLAGGKAYSAGYVQVVSAARVPTLQTGNAGTTTPATWVTKANGSFRIRFNEEWFDFVETTAADYRVDFAGDASMANVAASIEVALQQAMPPMLFGGQTNITEATWVAISDGEFQIWVDGVCKQYSALDFHLAATMAAVATVIDDAITADGFACEYDATSECLWFSHDTAGATHWLSYVEAYTGGSGTDISALIGARETDAGTRLNRRGKDIDATTTCKYGSGGTTGFTISTAAAGSDAVQFSFLEAPFVSTDKDISGASWMNGLKTASYATYECGATAGKTVVGLGTIFGEWAQGMQLQISGSEGTYLVDQYRDTDHLLLDAAYSGAALDTWTAYVLLPFDNQLYPSSLGNPFDYPAENIIQLPTQDNDGIVAQRVSGRNLLVWMRKHLWAIDAANPQSPRLVSNEAGAVNSECVVSDGTGWYFFDGETFWRATYNTVAKVDQDERVRDFIARMSTATRAGVHGQYIPLAGKSILFWVFGLDSSGYYDSAVVYHPSTGNWWIWNVHDMTCTCIVRDGENRPYLLSGSSQIESTDSYDDDVAWVFKHGSTYYADGIRPVTDGKTKEGVIAAVGVAAQDCGYLKCGAAGATIATWVAVTDGYFNVTIDGTEYEVGPINFSTATTLATVATLITTALVAAGALNAECTNAGAYLYVLSNGTTPSSTVSYLRPNVTGTDISGRAYMNGLEADGYSTVYAPEQYQLLTLYASDGATDATLNTADGETGIWVYVCDTNMENGQFAFVLSQPAANQIVVTPPFSTVPEAGWYWFLGAIDPQWFKWFDFGSPHHKHHLREIAITVGPESATHYMGLHVYADLDEATIRRSFRLTMGGTVDPVHTQPIKDRSATQVGVKWHRPSSLTGLKIGDVTVTQHTET